jgi:hypothetical protein
VVVPSAASKDAGSLGRLFFQEAAWEIHDASYIAASPARAICDRGFLAAMLRDASEARTAFKMALCTVLAWFLWGCVRALGWASYGHTPQ